MTTNNLDKIFKAYDIRGIYPEEINKEVAYLVGGAYIKFLKTLNNENKKKKLNIAVGRDGRFSSPPLFKSLIKGITDQGSNVIDIGLSTTPMLYFTVAYYGLDGGVNVTASHNPSKYNGFKLVRKKSIPIGEKTGLKKIKKLIFFKKFTPFRLKGKVGKKSVLKDYTYFNFKNFDFRKLQSLKIVIDTANSVSGIIIPEIFKKVPGKIYHLFRKLDGRFPNHPPNPLIKENLRCLRKEVVEKKADLGIAFDGDGDRIIFVDEKGNIVPADFVTAFISNLILKKTPHQKILYDLRSSNVIEETIKEKRGTPLMGRVGHSFIKDKMRKENIVFAGEFSGHYYHKNHYFCEAPFFILFMILEEISKTKKSLSKLISPFKKYFHSGEINLKTRDKEKILNRLEKKFKRSKLSKLDGLRIDFKDWWFNIRPSQTEPVLRLVIEAKTKKLLKEKKKNLISLISRKNFY